MRTGAAVLAVSFGLGCGGGDGGGGGGNSSTRQLQPEVGIRMTSPRFSPDGTRLAYARDDGDLTWVAVMSTTGDDSHDLTSDADYLTAMAWTGDGSRLIYAGLNDIRALAADGSDDAVQVVNAFAAIGPDLSPDGGALVYGRNGDSLELADLTETPPARTDLGIFGVGSPRFSPDGSTIAYWQGGTLQLMELASKLTTDVVTDDENLGMGGVDWFSDGRLLAGTDRGVEVITLAPSVARTRLSKVGAIMDVDLSPDETSVAYWINGHPSLFVLSGF